MTSRRPTKVEQFAIEAKLNLILGAEVYDRVFQGFDVLEVANGELRGWSPSQHRAAVIDVQFSAIVAWLPQPVRGVNGLMRGMSHDEREQPA